MGWVVFISRLSFLLGKKFKLRRYWGVSFFVLFMVSSGSLGYAEARGVIHDNFPGTLSLHNGKITAKINAVSLRQVMEEIGELSGAEVVWLQKDITGTVSADFSNVPFTRALRLLLGEKNFLLFYSSAGKETQLSQIWISSGGSAPTTTSTSPSSPVSMTLIRQWYLRAMRGANIPLRLQAVGQLKQHASNNARAKRMLSLVARLADNPQVKRAAAAAVATIQQQARK